MQGLRGRKEASLTPINFELGNLIEGGTIETERTLNVTGFFPPYWELGAGIKTYEELKLQSSYPQGDVNKVLKGLRGRVGARNRVF